MNRTQKVLRNTSTMLITYSITIFVSFLTRSVFIRQLGEEYLGLNGVFSSILSMLSISDLGMESVFAFLLYKPLARHDESQIRNLIALFRKVYSSIGLFIFVFGIAILPFLPKIIGNQGSSLTDTTLIYLIMLVNVAVSYLFTYNRTVLDADQKNYVISSVTFIIGIGVNILQIVFLFVIKSMAIYVFILLLSTILTNIILSKRVLEEYPYLKNLPVKSNLGFQEKKVLIQNTIGGMSNKLGTIIVFSSDNILLSIFVNLSMVGVYSNYALVINGITGLVRKVLSTITASVGNLSLESPERGLKFFKSLNFYLTVITFFGAPQLLTILRPFINWWVGPNYVLSQYTVLLIVVNFVLQISRLPALTYIDAYGLQWVQKWKSVAESILNIVFSLVALKIFNLGLVGILLGTILSTLLFVLWYEPHIVLRYAFKVTGKQQIKQILLIFVEKVWLVVPTIITWVAMHYMNSDGMVLLLRLVTVNFLILCVVFVIIFGRKREVKELLITFKFKK